MKKLFKFFVLALSVVVLSTACISLTACNKNNKSLEVTVSVYNKDDSKFEDKVLKVKLCSDVAPKTVEAIISAVNCGYYENTLFYKDASMNGQIMLGDIKIDGENIVRQKDLTTIEGEFDLNGFKNSNLTNKKGVIGLWRSWTADSDYNANNIGVDSGSAIMYFPTTTMSTYDKYFALFAQIDLEDATNLETFNSIINAFDNAEDYESYEIFYTGENADELTEIIVKTEDLKEDPDYNETANTYNGVKIFEAKGATLVSKNRRTVNVPKLNDETRMLYIKSVKVI